MSITTVLPPLLIAHNIGHRRIVLNFLFFEPKLLFIEFQSFKYSKNMLACTHSSNAIEFKDFDVYSSKLGDYSPKKEAYSLHEY